MLDERFELSKRWKAKKSKHGVDGDSDSSGLADVFTSLDAVFISQPEQIVRSGSRVASIHYISIYIYIYISVKSGFGLDLTCHPYMGRDGTGA